MRIIAEGVSTKGFVGVGKAEYGVKWVKKLES
jgi:hypothetical protein